MTSTASMAMWRSARTAMPVCLQGDLCLSGAGESPSARLVKRQYVNQPATGRHSPAVPM